MLTELSHRIPSAYVASHRFRASPGALSRALANPQIFQPPRDLQQPRFIALQLDLRPNANSVMRVSSANGSIEECRPLRITRHSLCRLTIGTEDDSEQEDTDAALALSFVLEPIHCGGRRLETRLTIATRIIPEPWWPRTVSAELAALTEWWLHRLKLHIAVH